MLSRLSHMKLPILLVVQLSLCLFFGHLIPTEIKAFFYALSLTIKSLLMFVLPFIIFSFISKSLSDLGRGALTYIILLLFLVVASNFIATCISGLIGILALQNGLGVQSLQSNGVELDPLWNFTLKTLVPNDVALLGGLILGIIISVKRIHTARQIIVWMQRISLMFLNRIFMRIIPLFILGFIFKMQHEGLLLPIVRDYFSIFLLITLSVYAYLILFYGVTCGFQTLRWFTALRRMLPAAVTGFSAMSSAAALPLILNASEKNVKNPDIVRGAIPMVVNIHLIGCNFAIPILSLAIMASFGLDLPTPGLYLLFAVYFVLAKFAVAAVPAGGIMVMLPVLERYMGFNGEMISLVTALYVLFDPIVTSANVMGNGGLAILFSKIYRK